MSKEKPQLQHRNVELLLAWLAADTESGARTYLDFHKRLTALFVNWSCRDKWECPSPEDLADETLNRVSRQLAEGKVIRTDNRFAFLHGVARNISLERWRKWENRNRKRVQAQEGDDNFLESLALIDSSAELEKGEEKERRLQCLDECLNELPPESRLLLLEYYSEDERMKIETRDRMAQHLGIVSAVLRNRIYKLRNSVRPCVIECLER